MSNTTSNKVLSLAKKLYALANDGTNVNECANAARLLQKLLKEHNLTIADLKTEQRFRCEYDIMLKHQNLFFQICYNVIEDWNGKYWLGKSRRIIVLQLTRCEQLELTAKFNHYVKHYDEQLSLFWKAFVVKHNIYPKYSKDYTETSKCDAAEVEKILRLAIGIQCNDFVNVIDTDSRLIEA